MMQEEFLSVKILTPNEVLWEGKASSISSENIEGPFDILPQHANFVSMVKEQPIIIKGEEEEKSFLFDNAVVFTQENKVLIFAQISLKKKKSPASKFK